MRRLVCAILLGCASASLGGGALADEQAEGTLELLMAVDREGSWRAVSPHWRSRRPYALEGYLLLDGRAQEGYVLPPAPRP